MANPMFEKLKKDEVALGFGLMYANPCAIECMAKGWDWVWIDSQHGQHAYPTILHSVQLAHLHGLSSMVRLPGHCPDPIGPVLDMAANSLMIPMVNTAEEAKALVRAANFPPLGTRSYGGRRVIDLYGRDYYRTANDEVFLVCQIETLEAVEQAEAIASVKGVGAIFFGPDDMKMRMGIPINATVNESPELARAMEKVAKAARNAGKAAGSVAVTPPALKTAVEQGYRLIVGAGDVLLLRSAAQKCEELRGVLAGLKPAQAQKGAVSPY
jgi:4-hydroxy-2-oxoheptanedioate aldolase